MAPVKRVHRLAIPLEHQSIVRAGEHEIAVARVEGTCSGAGPRTRAASVQMTNGAPISGRPVSIGCWRTR